MDLARKLALYLAIAATWPTLVLALGARWWVVLLALGAGVAHARIVAACVSFLDFVREQSLERD